MPFFMRYPSTFNRALYFLMDIVMMSLFRIICQTNDSIDFLFGTRALFIDEKFSFPIWSNISFCMALGKYFLSGSLIK